MNRRLPSTNLSSEIGAGQIGKSHLEVGSLSQITRRQFLKRSIHLGRTLSAVVAVPYIVPSSVLGKDGSVAPSERITLGSIGCGNRGLYDLTHFLSEPDVQCLAVCDCWESRREKAKSIVDKHHDNTDYGRNMKWNTKTERFINDPEADKMISRPMRRPWHL